MEIAPITFCDKNAFNVRNQEYKKNIFETLFNNYNIIVTKNSCRMYNEKFSSYLLNPQYLLSTNTKGNRYYLYLTKNEFNENFCYFIDRKICKGYKLPRIILAKYKFKDEVHNGTLLQGELVKDYDNNWMFIINDIISYCGNNCKRVKKVIRIKYMYDLLKNKYINDDILDVCKFKIKRFFHYSEIEYMIQEFIPNLKYPVNGIMFNHLYGKPDILLINYFKNKYEKEYYKNKKHNKTISKPIVKQIVKQIVKPVVKPVIKVVKPIVKPIVKPVKQDKNIDIMGLMNQDSDNVILNRDYMNFIIEKTEQGIFRLTSLKNKNKKVFGYARVNTLERQDMIHNLLKNAKEGEDIIVKCEYNKKFNKFIPIEKTNEDADQYIDVTQFVSKIK